MDTNKCIRDYKDGSICSNEQMLKGHMPGITFYEQSQAVYRKP